MIDLMMLCSTLDPFYTGQSFAWLDGYILNDAKQMDCFFFFQFIASNVLLFNFSSIFYGDFLALWGNASTHFDWSNFFFFPVSNNQ